MVVVDASKDYVLRDPAADADKRSRVAFDALWRALAG